MGDIDLSEYPCTDWKYVAEGGANLVVAYTGAKPRLGNTVLRVRKRALECERHEARAVTEEDASVAFTDRVVLPLLGSGGTPTLTSLRAPRNWLQNLAKHVEASRPPARRAVDVIDTDRPYVVLTDNLLREDVLGVEIKPKWGFLPNPANLSSETRDIKISYCRFCLHRLHRAQSGEHTHSHAGDYCPLDLYSGDIERTQRAVLSLVQAWKTSGGKGNNLKLFWKGRMISPQQLDETAELLLGNEPVEEILVHRLSNFLAASPLLARLKRLQARLDELDIEGLGKMLKEQEGIDILDLSSDDIFKLGGEIHLSEYEAFVHRFSAKDLAEHSTREAIISHLLSASFKDCSMIIQLGKEGGDIDAQLVDCDLKNISRLQRYAKLDQQLVETCRQHLDHRQQLPLCRA